MEGLIFGIFSCTFRHMKENTKQSWILDSTEWIPDPLSVQLGFRIPLAKISRIPESGFPYMW